MGKVVDRIIDWAIMLGVIGYLLVGTPVAPALQSAVQSNLLSTPWNGPGAVTVPNPTGCYAPSIPARPDLAPNPPYAQASVVQYIHGCDYGHAAIDYIAIGDSAVLSPLNGEVTRNGYDGIGNTMLVIENEQYTATLLHGSYTALPGALVRRGEPVGKDGSIGRSSGNHTHLNIYDKLTGQNVHPLALMK